VLGVGGAAAVTAHQYLAARCQALNKCLTTGLYVAQAIIEGVQGRLVRKKSLFNDVHDLDKICLS
jgi:hypothetical protein